ncbi:uncharacterized protein SAPINGB_P002597 [Magnusiomyces paraingens]|uniref:Spo7-like protein n=1 Tax=Magnusiomyces paraingens TaxID=2606893 RepID=A0A5E8BER5_9ASCO|nr:uncharacterized protein SAPINGB_P002597 [Saprochaete ingens]VVT50093.1 unnamed protein product [Saprochaete ingens]
MSADSPDTQTRPVTPPEPKQQLNPDIDRVPTLKQQDLLTSHQTTATETTTTTTTTTETTTTTTTANATPHNQQPHLKDPVLQNVPQVPEPESPSPSPTTKEPLKHLSKPRNSNNSKNLSQNPLKDLLPSPESQEKPLHAIPLTVAAATTIIASTQSSAQTTAIPELIVISDSLPTTDPQLSLNIPETSQSSSSIQSSTQSSQSPTPQPSHDSLRPISPQPQSQTQSRHSSRSQSPQTSGSSRRQRRRSSTASISSLSSDDGAPQPPPPRPQPGHPANIYRNLLIMEDSFRQEYVILRKTRRKYLLFNISMAALTLYFFYCVFIEPSIYRVIHFFNRLLLMIFATTIILFYISGSHRKTIGSSRKFIYNVNKGMRGFNIKLVRITQSWPETFIDWFWAPAYAARPGEIVKLVLSPRVFNPDIIEGWEIYRVEYWNKEYLKAQGKPVAEPSASPHRTRKSFASSSTSRPSSSSLRS